MKFTHFIGYSPVLLFLMLGFLPLAVQSQTGPGCAPALVTSTALISPECPEDVASGIRIEFKAGGTLVDPSAFIGHSWTIHLRDIAANCTLETSLNLSDPRVTRTGNSLKLDIQESDLLGAATNPCALTSLAGKAWAVSVTQYCDAPNEGPSPAGNLDTIVVPETMNLFYVAAELRGAEDPLQLGYCEKILNLDAIFGGTDTIGIDWLGDYQPIQQTLTICIEDWAGIPLSENNTIVLKDPAGGVFDQSDANLFFAAADPGGGDSIRVDTITFDGKRCIRLQLTTDGDGTDYSGLGYLATAGTQSLDCSIPMQTSIDQVSATDFRVSFDAGMRTSNHSFKVRVYQGGTCTPGGTGLLADRPNTDNSNVLEAILAADDSRLTRLDKVVISGTDTLVTDSFQFDIRTLGLLPEACTCYQVFINQICDGMSSGTTSSNWAAAQTKTFVEDYDCQLLETAMAVTPESCNLTSGGVRFLLEGGPCGARQVRVRLDGNTYYWYNVASIGGVPVTSSPGVFSMTSDDRLAFEINNLSAGSYVAEITQSDTLSPSSSMVCEIPFEVALLDVTSPVATLHLESSLSGAAYEVDTAGVLTAVGTTPASSIVSNKINLGLIRTVPGACAVDLDLLLRVGDNCNSNLQNMEVTLAVIQGEVSGTVFQGQMPDSRTLLVNIGSGAFEFDILINDKQDYPDNNFNRITLFGTIADQTLPVVTVPGNSIYQIPSCASATDVYFTVQANDACSGSLDVSTSVAAPGLTLEYISNGLFRAVDVPAGNYTVTVAGVADGSGNTAVAKNFVLQVKAPGTTVARQIIGAGNIRALVPFCQTGTEVSFDLFILDECASNPTFSSLSATGGYRVERVSNNRYRIQPRMSAGQSITVTAKSFGAADYNFTVHTEKAGEDQRPDITLPGNLTFTLLPCSVEENVNIGIYVDDDCTPVEALLPLVMLEGEILAYSHRTVTNGQLYLEYSLPVGKKDNGSILTVQVSDAYHTSQASAALTILQETAARTYACDDNVILTLGSDCGREIAPSMVLKGDESTICNDLLQVIVEAKDKNGKFKGYYHRNYVAYAGTYNYAVLPAGDQYVTYRSGKIVGFSSAASVCWGTLTAEDKSKPYGTCPSNTYTAIRPTVFNEWQGSLTSDRSFYPQVFSCYQSTWPGGISEYPVDPELVPNPAFPAYVDPGALHHYDTWTFRPAVGGKYVFTLGAGFDGMLALFQQQGGKPLSGTLAAPGNGWFAPALPCANMVAFGEATFGVDPFSGLGNEDNFAGNDNTWNWQDAQQPIQRLSLPLIAGREYTLVVTSRAAGVTGDFTVLVERDGAVATTDHILEFYSPSTDQWGNTVATWVPFPVKATVKELPLYCDDLNKILIQPTDPRCYTLEDPYAIPVSIDSRLKDKLSWTGFPVVYDNCGPLTVCVSDVVKKTGDCGEIYIERTFTSADAKNNKGEWFATLPGVPGRGAASCTQLIHFSQPSVSNLTLPHFTQYLECDESFATDRNGNPHPNVTGYPFVQSAFGYHDLANEWCNLGAAYSDEAKIPSCAGGYNIRREWTILDWCRPGKSVVYSQLIKVGDFTPPSLDMSELLEGIASRKEWEGVLTYAVSPFDCDADIIVPRPKSSDNCSADITLGFQIQEYLSTPLLDHFGNQVGTSREWQVIREGTVGSLVRSLAKDRTYRYRFIAKDACLNTTETWLPFRVLDLSEPIAVCDNALSVTLGGGSYKLDNGLNAGGYTRLDKADLQEGISDNCGPFEYWVRRVVAPEAYGDFDFDGDGKLLNDELTLTSVEGVTVAVTNYSKGAAGTNLSTYHEKVNDQVFTWQSYVEFFCSDAGTDVTVEMLVIDNAGNSSRCWMKVSVSDKTRPYCAAPVDFSGSCILMPQDFNPPTSLSAYQSLTSGQKAALHAQLDKLFGEAEYVDNCSEVTAFQEVTAINWQCGGGSITRKFWGVDAFGNQTPGSCFQTINIEKQHEYSFTFPADVTGSCAAAINVQELNANSGACDLLSVYTKDKSFEASGVECYKLFRTFEVVNWCQFNGADVALANPFIVGRDEDKDGKPGNRPVTVSFSTQQGNNLYEDYIVLTSGARTRKEGPICTPTASSTTCPLSYTQAAGPAGYSQTYSPGFFQYTQVITVFDDVKPVISAEVVSEYCSLAGPVNVSQQASTSWLAANCTGNVSIPVSIADLCTPADLELTAYLRPFGGTGIKLPIAAGSIAAYPTLRLGMSALIYEGSGANALVSGTLPVGNHLLELRGKDGCGNADAIIKEISVVDCKAPAPTCISGIVVELMPHDGNGDGTIDDARMAVWANDYIASDAYDCSGPVKYSIHLSREPELAGDLSLIEQIERFVATGDMELGDLLDPAQSSEMLTCEDAGRTLMVVIAAWDAAGNGDYCTTFLVVQDNNRICNTNTGGPAIAGLIATEKGHTVENVEISLSGSHHRNLLTQMDGNYAFNNLEEGADYSITPMLDEDHDNGVTTFDLIEIGKHILGVKALGSPYKMIAADVDNNRSITSLDLIKIRRLILSVDKVFANNSSWRFVDASFKFPNTGNPWATSFPEIININDLAGTDLSGDFVAIKVGDVTLDAKANSLMTGSRSIEGTFQLEANNLELSVGEVTKVPFYAAQLQDVQGFQFTLGVDLSMVELVDIKYGVVQAEHFGRHYQDDGFLTLSWNGKTQDLASPQVSPLFELVLRAKTAVQLSEAVEVTSRHTLAEAYSNSDQLLDVVMRFKDSDQSRFVELYQNSPNPFSQETSLGFSLSEASEVVLSISDLSGKTVWQQKGYFREGYHEISINREPFMSNSGMYYYTLSAGDFTETRKMIVLN